MIKGIAASAGVATAKAYKLEQPVVVIEQKTTDNTAAEIEKRKKRDRSMIKGIAASAGVATAKAYKLEQPVVVIEQKTTDNTAAEIEKLENAVAKTIADIEGVKERAAKRLKPDAAKRLKPEELEVFDAHLMMANDPELTGQMKAMIESDKVNAEYAADQVANMMIAMFESMDNDYFRERAADVKDVTFRLKCNLLGLEIPDLSAISEPTIIVAHDLTPSDTAQLNEFVRGFVTEIGGKTSHSAIMANSLEIPAVVGCGEILGQINAGDVGCCWMRRNPWTDQCRRCHWSRCHRRRSIREPGCC